MSYLLTTESGAQSFVPQRVHDKRVNFNDNT
jgi:hypothetical protein